MRNKVYGDNCGQDIANIIFVKVLSLWQNEARHYEYVWTINFVLVPRSYWTKIGSNRDFKYHGVHVTLLQ